MKRRQERTRRDSSCLAEESKNTELDAFTRKEGRKEEYGWLGVGKKAGKEGREAAGVVLLVVSSRPHPCCFALLF